MHPALALGALLFALPARADRHIVVASPSPAGPYAAGTTTPVRDLRTPKAPLISKADLPQLPRASSMAGELR